MKSTIRIIPILVVLFSVPTAHALECDVGDKALLTRARQFATEIALQEDQKISTEFGFPPRMLALGAGLNGGWAISLSIASKALVQLKVVSAIAPDTSAIAVLECRDGVNGGFVAQSLVLSHDGSDVITSGEMKLIGKL